MAYNQGSDETMEEKLARHQEFLGDIEKTPLWMESLPECLEENEELAAIQALVYEGDNPEEVAENLRECGNEAFQRDPRDMGDLRQAAHLYTEALKQGSKIQKNNSVYHSNRAAVWLALQRYGPAEQDCQLALGLNDSNVKAYYRASMANFKMERLEKAKRYATQGLEKDSKNKPLLTLMKKIDAKIKAENFNQAKREEREEKQAEKDYFVSQALKTRRIRKGKSPFPLDITAQYNAKVHLDDQHQLHIPFLFVYEEYNQTDFICDVCEGDVLIEHLSMMFPGKGGEGDWAGWDQERKYSVENLGLYFYADNDPAGEIVQFKLETPVLALMQHPQFQIGGELAIIYVGSTKSSFWKKKMAGQ